VCFLEVVCTHGWVVSDVAHAWERHPSREWCLRGRGGSGKGQQSRQKAIMWVGWQEMGSGMECGGRIMQLTGSRARKSRQERRKTGSGSRDGRHGGVHTERKSGEAYIGRAR
jgi:hypothetical protein